jgi:hypothetical protein
VNGLLEAAVLITVRKELRAYLSQHTYLPENFDEYERNKSKKSHVLDDTDSWHKNQKDPAITVKLGLKLYRS